MRITKGLFASCILFVVCYLPYAAIMLLDSDDTLHRTAYMYAMLLAHFNSSLNPILYAFTNSEIKKGYGNFLNYVLCNDNYEFS